MAKEVVGTPGMFRYPNGLLLLNKRYFNHTVERGDIVIVENELINEVTKKLYDEPGGLVKRIIAVPGDTIELRDGIVILNKNPQKEPYIARARSTFGGDFLPDCKEITIPDHKFFIMGDNRKGSGDSRHEIGLIDEQDIKFVLPFNRQKGVLDKSWHDPSNDLESAAKIKLNKHEFLELLNEKRKEFESSLLQYQPKLEDSSRRRGETVLKYNDFSFEATRSGYTMLKAMNASNYSNVVYGEWAVSGYYDAEELIDNLFAFSEGKSFLTNNDYDDFGISESEGQINNCPTQVVVLHFAGYVPPNYSREVIDSWKTTLQQLKEIQPGWQQLKTYSRGYDEHKNEVDRINEIISLRINSISGIVSKMDSNQWLTNEQQSYVSLDNALYEEQQVLAEKLNSY